MHIRKLFKEYRLRLETVYSGQEAESLVLWLFDHFLGVKRMDILRAEEVEIPPALEEALRRLTEGTPIQYILQSAPFYGRDFEVNPSVLIPRSETEELVHLIIAENKSSGLRILDVGTGSGCIPITLALEMNSPKIFATDISESALALAKNNSKKQSTESSVHFFLHDVLTEDLPTRDLDIIVSNPPYVKNSEKHAMHINVLEHEPHLALFIPDNRPLLFYETIASKGINALKPEGRLYFEINEALGIETTALLFQIGFENINLTKDLNGKDRMITAVKPSIS